MSETVITIAPGVIVDMGETDAVRVNAAAMPAAEILMYDTIGMGGLSAKALVEQLAKMPNSPVNVRINSAGGSVTDGVAIYNALRAHKGDVTVNIEGMAASIASLIAMAGKRIRIAQSAWMMIHNPLMAGGITADSEELRQMATTLDKMRESIASTYSRRTKKTVDEIVALMDAETWFTADEAVAAGFADEVIPDDGTSNRIPSVVNLAFNNVPDALRGTPKPEQPAPENSPCGEPPVAHQQEKQMADATPPVTAPAQPPAAGTSVSAGDNIAQLNNAAIQGYIEKGRQLGYAEGQRAAAESFRSIMAAAPGRADIAANAFLAGQNAQTVALIFDADNRARQEARAEVMKKDEEIARLHAVHATGGHAGVGFSASPVEIGSGVPEGLDPQAQAQMEYDTNPLIRAKNPDKKTWMLYRVNQLSGNVRVLAVK